MTDTLQPGILEVGDAVALLGAQVEQLERALASRDVIGQAKGILRERLKLTADDPFEQLRVASQSVNRKVTALAAELAATGEWPPADHGPEPNPRRRAHSVPFARNRNGTVAAANPSGPDRAATEDEHQATQWMPRSRLRDRASPLIGSGETCRALG